ncbi:MAG: hypothetical protein IT327_32285 [Anaerolineae bacterium]|nr:hypothetical protein [Anaerolineae bacterium]
MNPNLSFTDPLADQEVTIVITLAVGGQTRDERMALMSLGVTGQPPVTSAGSFGQVTTLIDQAWTAFGVQAQVAAAQGARVAGSAEKLAGETPDTPVFRADAASDEALGRSMVEAVAAPVSGAPETTPPPTTPKPQPDLSFLF